MFIKAPDLPEPTKPVKSEPRIPAADLLANFLKEKHIVLTPTVMDAQCAIADGGILLNEKPLIKIKVSYSDEK